MLNITRLSKSAPKFFKANSNNVIYDSIADKIVKKSKKLKNTKSKD